MELFIPSLLVIILGGIVFVFLLPRFSFHTLGVISIVLFILGIYQHWKTFPYEYAASETKNILKDYAPFIVLLLTILALSGMAMQMSGGSGLTDIIPPMPAMPELPAMPALNMPKMPNISDLTGGRPGNNRGGNNKARGILAMNGRRNNLASNSFKIT